MNDVAANLSTGERVVGMGGGGVCEKRHICLMYLCMINGQLIIAVAENNDKEEACLWNVREN